MNQEMLEIHGTPYVYGLEQSGLLRSIADNVAELRRKGSLTPEVLHRLRQYFKIKNIYHSNAIEGNLLDIGETRQVIELGFTITGKSLKDQAEAKNLAHAVDFLETLVRDGTKPITEFDIRQIHGLVLKGIDDENAGAYRKVKVQISGSEYEPPSPEHVPHEMHGFGKWLSEVSCSTDGFASEKAILYAACAHTWLVYIHPFIDGNGRVARLLMNLILMRCGFPIAIITREDRLRYYDALEESQSSDLSSFVSLLVESIHESLEEYEAAAAEQRDREEWARSLASKFSEAELVKAQNEYEVWRSAMDLLKSYMHQTASLLDETAQLADVFFRDFGSLEFEKYLSLRQGESAKKTWFFRLDFRRADRVARYLFFFGNPSRLLVDNCKVTLHVARETPPGSFYYERLQLISEPNVPGMIEIGYNSKSEKFVQRIKDNRVKPGKIEALGKTFFEEVIQSHFSN